MNEIRSSEGGDESLPFFSYEPPPLDNFYALDGDALFAHNIEQINQMDVAAGSMVKGLIMELERGTRDTFIRLRGPEPGGHRVGYDFVRGDRSLVGKIARSLGFALVTDDRLEVRGG